MPLRRREIDNDTDDLLDDITALYRRGRSRFYAEFGPLAKRLRTVNKHRRLYEEEIQDGLPEHPIEQVIDLYTARRRDEDGTWAVKWIKLGKALGLVDSSARDEDDEEVEEANIGTTKTATSGGKARGVQGNEDEAAQRDETRRQPSNTVDTKGKAKERPQPVPTVRKDRAEAATGTSKTKVMAETRKGAKPAAAAGSSSKPTAASSKSIPAASSSKPRSRTAAKAYKSKATITDSDDDDVVVVAKPKSKTKGVFRDHRDTAEEAAREVRDKRAADRRKGKAAAAAAALEKYGESEEPLDGFSEDAEGDVEEEEAAVDPNEPPLSKARRRIQEREDSKKIVVFDACHPCIRSGVQCTFSKKRIREANNNAKVVCDHCKQGKTKCVPGPGPEFSLDTPFTDYEDLLFPQRGEGALIGKGMEGEGDDVKTVGDVLATLVREQRVLADQLTSLTEEVQGLRSGMSTAPQYGKGVAAAVADVGMDFTEFHTQYKLNEAHNTVVLEALGIRLTALAQKVEDNDISSTLSAIMGTLEGMTTHRDERRRRRRSESTPQLDDSDEDFAPRTVHRGKQESGNDDNKTPNGNDDDDDHHHHHHDDQDKSSSDDDFVVKKTYSGGGVSGNDSDVQEKTPNAHENPEGEDGAAKDGEGPSDDVTEMKVDDKENSPDAEPQEAEQEKRETEKPEEETEGNGEEGSRVSEEREATPKADSRTRPRRNTRSKTAAADEGERSPTEESTAAAATTTMKSGPSGKKRKATAPPESDSAASKKKGKNTNS